MLVLIGKLGINVQKSFSSWLWLLKLGWKVRQINSICFVNYQPNKVCETLNKNTFCICFEQYAKFILVLWYCTDLLLLSLLPNFIMMHVCVPLSSSLLSSQNGFSVGRSEKSKSGKKICITAVMKQKRFIFKMN